MSSASKNVETIRWLLHEDRRRTIKDILAIVNVLYRTVQTILTCDLNMHLIAAKFILVVHKYCLVLSESESECWVL